MVIERFFAGIDGGATKTLCIISDSKGNLLGRGESGPSNSHNIGLDRAIRGISGSVRRALVSAAISSREVERACFGLAGLDSPIDIRRVTQGLRSLRLAKAVKVVHDTVVALAGALGGERGIIVIAGTGSVAGGVDSRGRMVRVGGWGSMLDDEGSAYDIGRSALRSVLRAYDGREPQTALRGEILTKIGADTPEGIIEAVYVRGMGVSEVASLARIVVDLASRGDRTSREILTRAGESLADLAIAAASKLGFQGEPFRVSYVGGVFSGGRYVMRSFKARLREADPLSEIVPPRFPPAIGSLILAMRDGGIPIDVKILNRFRRQFRANSA